MTTRSKWSTVETLLACALLAVFTLYVYYFILIPQSWTLRDDYSYVLGWTGPGVDVWQKAWWQLHHIMGMGRFQPVDLVSRALHYGYLPTSPRLFHLSYFALAAVALAATYRLLVAFELTRARLLLAFLLIVSNQSLKEWLTTLSASETLATTFFMVALACYASGRRWLATPIFVLSFCSKESFFIMCGTFVILEFALGKSRSPKVKDYAPALLPVAAAFVFVLFINSLPHLYTAGLSFSKILAPGPVLRSLLLPPLRSFGPALLLVALSSARVGALSRKDLGLAGLGTWIVVTFTLFLNAWGPFDSWFYLHMAIPFGWAFLAAAVWRPRGTRIELALAAATLAFAVLVTANGGRNYTNYFATAKTAADLACADAELTAGLKVFNNCSEGSDQLVNYLRLSGTCKTPPAIQFLGNPTLAAGVSGNYDLLISTKCEPFDFGSLPSNVRLLRLDETWTLARARIR